MPVNPALDISALRSEIDKSRAPWQVAYTSMTALTEEERVRRLGVSDLPEIDEEEQKLRSRTAASAAHTASGDSIGAPAAFDLRNVSGTNYTTKVKDQGGCGSCVSFGVAGTLEHVSRFTRGTPNLPVDLSEAHLYYVHGRAVGATCASGWLPEPALDACRDKGITFEDYYPYSAGDQNGSALNTDWPNHRVKATSWQGLTSNPALMKQHISQYGSITACFYVYQDFFSYGTGVYKHVSGALAGGHCVVLVGYDDALGCWIGKNSWNDHWGDSGFFKIAYGQCGIESWHVCGVPGTAIRSWLPNQQILGLWSNEYDSNVWAYGSMRGWLKLDGSAVPTGQSMLSALAADKAGGQQVGFFEDNGVATQIYAW